MLKTFRHLRLLEGLSPFVNLRGLCVFVVDLRMSPHRGHATGRALALDGFVARRLLAMTAGLDEVASQEAEGREGAPGFGEVGSAYGSHAVAGDWLAAGAEEAGVRTHLLFAPAPVGQGRVAVGVDVGDPVGASERGHDGP